MKKNLPIAIIATAVLGLGSLTSCQDEDLGVSTQTLKERAFDDAFAKQFGKPSPNQSWDFFTQTMQNLRKGESTATTRAQNDPSTGSGYSVAARTSQPSYITTELVNRWDDLLPEYQNNYTMGQTQYTLVSSGSGNFTISAIWYGGAFEIWNTYSTHLYLCFNDANNVYREVELFEGKALSDFGNPGLSDEVHLDAGTEFWFLLEYRQNGNNQPLHSFYSTQPIPFNYGEIPTGNHQNGYTYTDPNTGERVTFPYSYTTFQYKTRDYYHVYNGCSQLLYSEYSYTDNEIDHFMVIGFEDGWHYLNYLDFDYNDIVIYVTGDLPIPAAKRVFTEDLEQYDWDFNDVVFDIEYRRIVLRAVGGTKPVYLQFRDVKDDGTYTVLSTTEELHDLMAKSWRYVNPSNNQIVYPYPDGAPKIDGTDWYKPLNVGSPDGLDMLPALIMQYDPISDEELEEKGTKGDIVLLVGEGADQEEFSLVSKTDKNGNAVISYSAGDKAPAMFMGLVQTRWPKEKQLISKGYPWFYDQAPAGEYWYSNGVEEYLY